MDHIDFNLNSYVRFAWIKYGQTKNGLQSKPRFYLIILFQRKCSQPTNEYNIVRWPCGTHHNLSPYNSTKTKPTRWNVSHQYNWSYTGTFWNYSECNASKCSWVSIRILNNSFTHTHSRTQRTPSQISKSPKLLLVRWMRSNFCLLFCRCATCN